MFHVSRTEKITQENLEKFLDENKIWNHKLLYAYFEADNKEKRGAIRSCLSRYNKKKEEEKRVEEEREKQAKKDKEKLKGLVTWEQVVETKYNCKCYHCPGIYANEVMQFVGFRGRLDKNGKCHLDMKGAEHRGEAFPPPIVLVTKKNRDNLKRITGKTEEELKHRYFIGILRYELELMVLTRFLSWMGYTDFLRLLPRGHGKTFMNSWDDQIDLKWFQQNIMMLSETSARFKVGNWIYLWSHYNGYLMNPEAYARKNTYQHFELLNGTRMDIYKYMEENLVGEHNYILVMDDVVKKKWKSRPTDCERAKEQWNSNISLVIHPIMRADGTRKFEGDPLQHFMETIEELVIIKMSPFVECPHDNRNPDGTFDPCPICKNDCLLAPEIHSYEDLMAKKEEDYDAWNSEMMQNPHALEGGMVSPEDIHYVRRPHWTEGILMGGTGVDCADTTELTNDFTGIISCLLQQEQHEDETWHRKFIFYYSDVARRLARNSVVLEKKKPYDWIDDQGRRIVRGIIETVQLHFEVHKRFYINIPWGCAWERNKAGIAIMEQALRAYRNKDVVEIKKGVFVKLTFPAFLFPDPLQAAKRPKKSKTNVRLGITHVKEKETRITSELQYSIVEGQACFTVDQQDTIFMQQVLKYPKGHDDGPDAGGMIKDELNRRYVPKDLPKMPREALKIEKLEQEAMRSHQQAGMPWLKDKPKPKRKITHVPSRRQKA